MAAPSKYHERVYIGKGIDGADERGYRYSWNTSHPDLTVTKTESICSTEYCVYCCKPAHCIQAGLRKPKDYSFHSMMRSLNYDVTGYTCICKGAEAEREYNNAVEELKERLEIENNEKSNQLYQKFSKKMKTNPLKLLRLKHKEEIKSLKLHTS